MVMPVGTKQAATEDTMQRKKDWIGDPFRKKDRKALK